MTATTDAVRPIDPLAPVGRVYRDHLVEVRPWDGVRPRRSLGMVRTEHFDVVRDDRRVRIGHRIPATGIHAGISGLVARELFGSGWLRGSDLFERIVTGIVVTSGPDPLASWEAFYRNSLTLIDRAVRDGVGADADPHGSIEGHAPVYARADRWLVGGSVLELGSCFGFFSLRAARTRRVTAVDLCPGTVRLLDTVAPRLGAPVETVTADAAHVPLPDGSADTVVALHLLEHLEPEHGDQVVAEARRLAARRVIVAVPLEHEPEETWGHVRTVTLDDLEGWGRASGRPYAVHEHHGGWLVLD